MTNEENEMRQKVMDEESIANLEDNDESFDSESECENRRIERERRSAFFEQPDENKCGRGKRIRNKTLFSFLQTKYKDLTEKD